MEKLYTIREIVMQNLLGVKERKLRALIKEGKLTVIDISAGMGRPNYRIQESAINKFREENTISA